MKEKQSSYKYLLYALINLFISPLIVIGSNILNIQLGNIIIDLLIFLLFSPILFIIVHFIYSGKNKKKEALSNGKVIYSFKDKFLSLKNEERITARQFISRIFTPGLLISILHIFLVFPLLNFIGTKAYLEYILYMPFIYIIGYSFIILLVIPKLIVKRCQDFNSNGIITKNIFLTLFVSYFLTNILLITYLGEYLPIVMNDFDFILIVRNFSQYGIAILGLYLLFRYGTKGKNDYGDDTKNVKIGLLG